MSRFLHHSRSPLLAVRSEVQRDRADRKPDGLWISVEGDDDWRMFCQSERFNLDGFRHTAEIVLANDANILRVNSVAELLAFGHRYGERCGDAWYHSERDNVAWRRVADEYQGIIIAPYQWKLRCDDRVNWYYGWDCASGCIWDANAIGEIRQVDNVSAEAA